MKKLLKLLIATSFLLSSYAASAKTIGKLGLVIGKVEVREGKSPWKKARIGMPLTEKMSINTGFKSKAIVKMSNGTRLTVKASTMINFAKFTKGNAGTATTLNLRTGGFTAKIAKQAGKTNGFRVRTPTAVAGVRGSGVNWQTNGEIGDKFESFEHGATAFNAAGQKADIPEGGKANVNQGLGGGPGHMQMPDQLADRDMQVFMFDPNMTPDEMDAMFDSFDPQFGSPDDFLFLDSFVDDVFFDQFEQFLLDGETVQFEKL